MRLLKAEFLISICGILLIGITAIELDLPQPVMGQFGIGYGAALDRFVALGCVQGLIYFAAVLLVLQAKPTSRTLLVILGFAGALRLMVVASPPFLSNDMYRYIWDGWVQAAGINPYRYIPDDTHLAFLRDTTIFPNINRASYAHTIYPPAAEMIFLIVSKISAALAIPPVLAMKLAMTALEATGIWAILRLLVHAGLPRERVIIYAWNPVPIWEFAGNGHVDAITICFISLALLAAVRGKNGWSATSLAIATLAKFLPLVLLPALWRRWDWKFAAVFTIAIVALYAPYLGVGEDVLGFLGGYSTQEGIQNGQGVFLLSVIGRAVALPRYAPGAYLAFLVLLLTLLSAIMFFGKALSSQQQEAAKTISRRVLMLGCVLMLGLSPHYPWYYCWLLIPTCVIPWPCALYLVTATFLLYLNPIHTKLLWPTFLYGPFIVLAIRDVWAEKISITMIKLQLAEGDRT